MARARTEPQPVPDAEPQPEAEEAAVEPGPEEIASLSVFQALSKVMGEVQHISKSSRNSTQNFNFRGIDAVLNACGPAFRKWGVIVVPIDVIEEHENYTTKSGTAMKNVQLTVTFRFYGPQGDYMEAMARGEAADSGDKATPKAHSVALRTVLLQALCIPTDEPDPDADSHERVHESGFERGARPTDAQARPRAQDTYNYPKDWAELAARMSALLGDEEMKVWLAQAIEVTVGSKARIPELPEADQRVVWDALTKVLRSLDEELKVDPNAFPPPTRDEVAGEFAKHLDGVVLAGPQWALSGEEAEAGMPSKEVFLGAAVADDAETPTEESAAEPQPEAGIEPETEPPSEGVEEQQRLLDEEAAAAADRA